MAKRSIGAQIEEVTRVLEDRRNTLKGMRGAELSRTEEHILRLECVLTTLQWVRDHTDIIRQVVRHEKTTEPDRAQAAKVS